MITTFITAQIVWTLLGTPCDISTNLVVAGCYDQKTNIIYIKKDIDVPFYKKFTLYHEIGHSLYWNKNTSAIFPPTEKTYPEVTADDFALYILKMGNLTKGQKDFFKKTCPTKCVKEILSINIKEL